MTRIQTLSRLVIFFLLFMDLSTTFCNGQAYHFSKGWLPGKRSYSRELLQNTFREDPTFSREEFSCRTMAGLVKLFLERLDSNCAKDKILRNDMPISGLENEE